MMSRDRNPLLGLLPHRGTITIELVATAATAERVDRLIEKDVTRLRDELGSHIISEDERELPEVVADLLSERGLTISVAEIGTGGLLAYRLSGPDGAQHWFRGGLVLNSETDLAGQSGESDPGGSEIALALAEAARQKGNADVGVGVGPVIVPADSNRARPFGEVHVAVKTGDNVTMRRLRVSGDRRRVSDWAADAVLALVRKVAMEIDEDSQSPKAAGSDLSDWLWAGPPR
jgi:nicotinamide-nucleotide amidase